MFSLTFFSEAALAALRKENTGKRPNILIAVADDWSFPHASAYGCAWVKTPAFDRVAREGLLFQHAYTPNAKCAPSRACLLTGRNSWQLKEAGNHVPYFPLEFKTYPEALAACGYFVGYTGKGWAPGVAQNADGSARELLVRRFNSKKAARPTTGISPVDYAANFADFLAEAPKDGPWCFWYGGQEPHRKYEYGSGIAKGGKAKGQIDRIPGYWPDNDTVRTDMLDYAYEVEHFDKHLGLMIAMLEKSGQLEGTLIIVTGDNGMPFPRAKGFEYEISNHMPFAVRWGAGIEKPGRVVSDYISFVDVAPTLLDAACIHWKDTGMQAIAGRSLRPIFETTREGRVEAARDHVVLGQERHDVGRPNDEGYPIRSIISDGWLYVKNFEPTRWPAGNPETGYMNTDGGPTKTLILAARRARGSDPFWDKCFARRPPEELYLLTEDPDCLKNLAGDSAQAERLKALRSRLMTILTEQGDPRMAGNGAIFDRYPYAEEDMRGFYEKYRAGKAKHPGWVEKSDFETAPLP